MTAVAALDRTILLCRDFVGEDEANAGELARGLGAVTACIVADDENLASGAAQAAVTALAGQVLATGGRVRLLLPDVPVIGHQPPLTTRLLASGIQELAGDSIPGAVAEVTSQPSADDVVFVIGDTPWLWGDARSGWRLWATPWEGVIGPVEGRGRRIVGNFPIGGLAAATLATAEWFKLALRRLLAGVPSHHSYSELEPALRASVRLSDDDHEGPVSLGHVDFVSGGAIVNAALHALLRIPGLSGHFRIIEPEVFDITNLNRYPLGCRSHVGMLKTSLLKLWEHEAVRIEGLPRRFDDESAAGVLPFASRVVVGTDDIPTRWTVQRARLDWLVVGATHHFFVMTSEHRRSGPCAGCAHPFDDGVRAAIPTVSFVSYWAGLDVAARLLRHAYCPAGGGAEIGHLWPLRLDGPNAVRCAPLLRSEACPLGCRHVDAGPQAA